MSCSMLMLTSLGNLSWNSLSKRCITADRSAFALRKAIINPSAEADKSSIKTLSLQIWLYRLGCMQVVLV